MAKANEKDIVIRITGKDLTGPAFAGVTQHAKNLTRHLDSEWRAQQSRQNEALRAEQVVSRARIKMAETEAREIRRIELQGAASRFKDIRTSERLAAYNRNKAAQAAAAQAAGPGFFGGIGGGAAKKAFGAAGLAAGMVGESFGGTAGQVGSAIGNVGGAAAMGGMAAGPWGAAIFGGIAALKEFKNAVDGAAEAAKEQKEAIAAARAQAVAGTLARMEGVSDIRRELVADTPQNPYSIRKRLADALQVAREREESAKQNLNVVSRFTTGKEDRAAARERSVAQGLAMAERDQAEKELRKVDNQIAWTAFSGRMGHLGRGLAIRGQLAGQGFAAPFMTAGRALFRGAESAAGGLGASWEMNTAARIATESPAERLRRELGIIASQSRHGLSPENARRQRQQLYFAGIGQLSGQQDNPSLAAAQGRFITRGPQQKTADEISAFRREAKEHARANERALIGILNEIRGEGEQT